MNEARDAADTAVRSEVTDATLRGVRWITLARGGAEVLGIAGLVVLARLIPPEQFGLAVIALIINELGVVLSGGLGAALVQRGRVERRHLECAALLSIALGCVLSATTFLAAPLAGRLFGDGATGIAQLIAPVFLLTSLTVVPLAILQRRLDFRRSSLIELAAMIVRLGAAVAAAFAGLDAEALVLGTLAAAATGTALLIGAVGLPRPRWHRREVRELCGFGVPAALANLSFTGFRNVDYAILGARLGTAQLGFYWRAYQLGVDYQRKITDIAQRLALPVYSRAGDHADMRAMRVRLIRTQAAIIVPLLAGFIAVAPVLIPWALGQAWTPSVLPAQILAGAGMLVSLQSGIGPLIAAAGHPRALLGFNVASAGVYAAVILAASSAGLVTVCIGVVAFHVAQLVASQLWLARRLLGIGLGQLVTDVRPAVVSSAALCAVALLARGGLEQIAAPAPIVLAGALAAGGAAYLLALRTFFPAAWADISLLAGRLVPARLTRRRKIGQAMGVRPA